MKKLVTTRQLILILILNMITLKTLVLPNLFAQTMGRDSYLFIFFMLLLDFSVLLIFLYLTNKFKGMSFYEMLVHLFGKVIAKIIMFCFFAFFINKCTAVFETNYTYLNENLYTFFNWYNFSLPVMVLIVFISFQGVNAFARSCEILVPIIILGFIISIIIGSFHTDFTNLLPFMEKGVNQDVFKFSFWFGDPLIFIMFFGNIKMEKRSNAKIITSIFVTMLLISAFFAVFYAKYNNSSVCHLNAVSDLTQSIPSMSDVGSFDWVMILIWDVALFIFYALNALGAFYSFRQVVCNCNHLFVVCGIALTVFFIVYFNDFDIFFAVNFNLKYFKYPCLFVQYALPAFIFVGGLFKRRKIKDEVSLAK